MHALEVGQEMRNMMEVATKIIWIIFAVIIKVIILTPSIIFSTTIASRTHASKCIWFILIHFDI